MNQGRTAVHQSAEVHSVGCAETVNIHFTYFYTFRMRPNAYPKQLYRDTLRISPDAPFCAAIVSLILEGRKDEESIVLEKYVLQIDRPPCFLEVPAKFLIPDHELTPTMVFEPGDAVNLSIIRDGSPARQKLRKRKNGGQGVNITVLIRGWKIIQPPRSSKPETLHGG